MMVFWLSTGKVIDSTCLVVPGLSDTSPKLLLRIKVRNNDVFPTFACPTTANFNVVNMLKFLA